MTMSLFGTFTMKKAVISCVVALGFCVPAFAGEPTQKADPVQKASPVQAQVLLIPRKHHRLFHRHCCNPVVAYDVTGATVLPVKHGLFRKSWLVIR